MIVSVQRTLAQFRYGAQMHTIIKVRSRIDIDFTDTKHKALKQKKNKKWKGVHFFIFKIGNNYAID